jgi:hypothetical protein
MKPFLSGRNVHSSQPLQPVLGAVPTDPSARSGFNHAQHQAKLASGTSGPTVECVKEGDKIVRLIVSCTCGERIEIECLNPAGG